MTGTSMVAQTVKNLPAMREIWVWSLGWEDPLEKGKATHCTVHGVTKSRTPLSDFHFHFLWHAHHVTLGSYTHWPCLSCNKLKSVGCPWNKVGMELRPSACTCLEHHHQEIYFLVQVYSGPSHFSLCSSFLDLFSFSHEELTTAHHLAEWSA